MAVEEIDLKPTERITTDATGKPGKRVFYIQGQKGDQVITLLVEKVQIQTMSLGVEEFISEVHKRFPNLPEAAGEFIEEDMHIHLPVDPLFRIGDLGLAYDTEEDLLVLVAREAAAEGEDPEQLRTVRFWCTRSQILALSRWSLELSSRGRPVCPYCGEPMNPEGHFCPKRNGHKK